MECASGPASWGAASGVPASGCTVGPASGTGGGGETGGGTTPPSWAGGDTSLLAPGDRLRAKRNATAAPITQTPHTPTLPNAPVGGSPLPASSSPRVSS